VVVGYLTSLLHILVTTCFAALLLCCLFRFIAALVGGRVCVYRLDEKDRVMLPIVTQLAAVAVRKKDPEQLAKYLKEAQDIASRLQAGLDPRLYLDLMDVAVDAGHTHLAAALLVAADGVHATVVSRG
jgi:hypothetical protein